MKKLSIFLILFSILSSCVKDLNQEDTRQFNSENEWIYDIMKDNYLYREDWTTKPSYSQEPESFFASLLSKRDGKGSYHFSRIETKKAETRSSSEESTYGLHLLTYVNQSNIPQFSRVLYVLKDSPAENAGVERGDYIIGINNEKLSESGVSQLSSGSNKTLNIIKNQNLPAKEEDIKTIKLSASVPMENNPIYMSKVIEQNGIKIGYIVYNHFTSGLGEESSIDSRYNDALCTLSKELSNQGITELVLDFRYNGGGEINAAQVMATLIAPKYALGSMFCKLKDVNGNITSYKFDKERIKNGLNLNLNRLFVLTTKNTASASELIINSLRPYMEVVIIGDRTVGKNVASVVFKHEKFNHILKPITHYVYNKDDKADYDNGFEPNFEVFNDYSNANVRLYDLGDKNEYLLKQALIVIAGGIPKNTKTKSANLQYNYTIDTKADLIIN